MSPRRSVSSTKQRSVSPGRASVDDSSPRPLGRRVLPSERRIRGQIPVYRSIVASETPSLKTRTATRIYE